MIDKIDELKQCMKSMISSACTSDSQQYWEEMAVLVNQLEKEVKSIDQYCIECNAVLDGINYKQMLGNLLALLNRDGGQTINRVGFEGAMKLAKERYCTLLENSNKYEDLCK